LDLTVHRERHVSIDLSGVRNPLFHRYLRESKGEIGLSVTDRFLLLHFHTAESANVREESIGVDINMPTMDFATSDGQVGSVDLRPITRIQGAMARKRASVRRAISKDRRHQRAVLRRYRGRERRRVTPLLHAAANQLLAAAGDRNIILEDLTLTTDQLLKGGGSPDQRRRLSSWTHGQLYRFVTYKSHTRVVRVNPRGTSSECPRCGGPLAHPSWRRATCGNCQVDYHRDRMAAVAILSRGSSVLGGAAHPPNALHELLESARWRPDDESRAGPVGDVLKGDEATAADCEGI
jgi:putative transposase